MPTWTTTADALLSKTSTLTTTADAYLSRLLTTTADAYIVDTRGSFRGTMTEADRDATPTPQTGDTFVVTDPS